MTASRSSIITVMNDEKNQLNSSNQIDFYLKIVLTRTLSTPFIVVSNYMLFAWQKKLEWQIIVSPFEFSPDLFQTQQPDWMGLHVSALNFPLRRSRLRWIKAAQIGIQLTESVIEGHFTFGNKEEK